jgi:hypothetical protein
MSDAKDLIKYYEGNAPKTPEERQAFVKNLDGHRKMMLVEAFGLNIVVVHIAGFDDKMIVFYNAGSGLKASTLYIHNDGYVFFFLDGDKEKPVKVMEKDSLKSSSFTH